VLISEAQDRVVRDSIILSQRAADAASVRAQSAIGVALHELQHRAAGARRLGSSARVWTWPVQLQLRKNVASCSEPNTGDGTAAAPVSKNFGPQNCGAVPRTSVQDQGAARDDRRLLRFSNGF